MEYQRIQLGSYEPDISWVSELWNNRISEMKKQGLFIEVETKREERWRIHNGELNFKAKTLNDNGVRALYPITYVYEVRPKK